jgi:hypothetical protein
VSVRSTASPEAVYDVLSDLRTHLAWAGEQAPDKAFRLLSMDAPSRPVTVGDQFSSSGANVNGTFHDRSTVVQAERGVRFGFDTESTLSAAMAGRGRRASGTAMSWSGPATVLWSPTPARSDPRTTFPIGCGLGCAL